MKQRDWKLKSTRFVIKQILKFFKFLNGSISQRDRDIDIEKRINSADRQIHSLKMNGRKF